MNPFSYGKEVTGYQFYDRKDACEDLYHTLKDGSANVVLYAPRRYGKTSLVLRVLQRFKSEGVKCVHFDFSKVDSIERFCTEYTAAVYSLWGGMPELVNQIKEYLVHLHPTFSFGDGFLPKIGFSYGERMGAQELGEVLDLPEKLARRNGREPVMVAFDEFQDVSVLSKSVPLEAVFRSAIQAQVCVRYVFLGSKTHLMRRMFESRSRPFYKSALGMKIGKPPREESEEFVVSRFAAEGIEMPAATLECLLAVSENIPYYLQAMAALSYRSVENRRGNRVESGDLDWAVARFLEGSEDYYEEVLRNLSAAQRPLVEAFAHEPTGRFDTAYREKYRLGGVSTVHSSIRSLMKKGVIDSVRGVYGIVDPFFAQYVRTLSAVKVV